MRREVEDVADLFDWRKIPAHLANRRVNGIVHYWDAYYDEEGVEIVENVVGDAAEVHGGGLGDEVAGHLVVC